MRKLRMDNACRVTDPTLLTKAAGDMEIAYSDAAGRILPDLLPDLLIWEPEGLAG
jgi:hypothetical protein